MKPPVGWARCLDSIADVLRRGAWYPILEETADGKVVVEVQQRPVRLSRVDVQVRETPPDRWSVVVRTGVLPPYAVCPNCRERQDFDGRPSSITCTGCARTSEVDWAATC